VHSSSPLPPEAFVVENEEKGIRKMDGKTGLERGNGNGFENWTGKRDWKKGMERD
jgi:hypothetical protein